MKLTLKRLQQDNQGTIGALFNGDAFISYLIELPWRDNQTNISRIPAGEYQVQHMPRSSSGKYKDVYHVLNVPKRGGILIHGGNFSGDTTRGYLTHTWGCLLPCKHIGKLNGQRAGLASRAALNMLHTITHRKNFILQVQNHE